MQFQGMLERLVVLTLAASPWVAAQTPHISFTTSSQPTNQESATGLVVADFAHHGNFQTAVIARDGSVQIAIPVNDPNSGNLTWNSYTVGAGPDQIVTADFNHDGNLDLAIEDGDENRISILLGNGDGSFRAAPDVVVERSPKGLIAIYFDGDGFADLAVIDCSTLTVCTLKRYKANPNSWAQGEFVLQQTISLPGNTLPLTPGMITSIDFNKDGLNDVALIANNNTVMVFNSSRNGSPTSPDNGMLTLHSQFDLPAGTSPTAIAWGSLNLGTPPVPDLVVRVVDACKASCGYTNSALCVSQ
jgi:FG-GAP-like repeat